MDGTRTHHRSQGTGTRLMRKVGQSCQEHKGLLRALGSCSGQEGAKNGSMGICWQALNTKWETAARSEQGWVSVSPSRVPIPCPHPVSQGWQLLQVRKGLCRRPLGDALEVSPHLDTHRSLPG